VINQQALMITYAITLALLVSELYT
jgi:hypothetical protein